MGQYDTMKLLPDVLVFTKRKLECTTIDKGQSDSKKDNIEFLNYSYIIVSIASLFVIIISSNAI